MGRLLWRIAVVTALALILGPALGFVDLALWTVQQTQTVMVINGSVPLLALLLALWATQATPPPARRRVMAP